MKDWDFDTQIVAATPHSDITKSFVKDVMKKINQQQFAGAPANRRHSFINWLRHLHKPAIALAAFVGVILLGGAVYAAVHFAPALVQLASKETNQRGATEYSVAGFETCRSDGLPATDRFELNAEAPQLSDKDVQKIVQAKCELSWIDGFIKQNWPTYGTNPEWKDGDKIYYTRTNVLGTVTSVNSGGVTVKTKDGTKSESKTVPGEPLKAYLGGAEIPVTNVKPGDTVFTIVRVSEVYHDMGKYGWDKEKNEIHEAPRTQPEVIGLVALFKMSLPGEYYGHMQGYITEIPACVGNPDEYCANTPSADIYPRVGGEGATNPYSQNSGNDIYREISGTVTELSDGTLTLKSRKGNLYTVTVGDSGFMVYNRDYAPAYAPHIDARLKVGSNVAVRYSQPKGAYAKKITKEQVERVVLQLEGINPKKSLKPY